MSYALIFSGQGMQHAAMLPWLADDELVRRTADLLGTRDWRAALSDAAWAANNAHAQRLLTGLGLAAWRQLAARLPAPAAIAGYSVGELAAFAAAGVFDDPTALELAATRAEAMDRAAASAPGGLMAVSGLAPDRIVALCAATGVELAIRNGHDSVVCGGPHAALDAAQAAATAAGARCTRLAVAVASHTSWMRPAATRFLQTLQARPFAAPHTALFSHAAGRVRDAEAARAALAAQLAVTVRWDDCMDELQARGVRCVLEVGPGAALARMWNERVPEIPARSCDEFRGATAIAQWVNQRSAA